MIVPAPHRPPGPRADERGFTLIEVLVAMTLTIIVLLALLDSFDSFSRNVARQTRVTQANEHVRVEMDRIVSDLRQASSIEVADPNDLVYNVRDGASAYRRERICLDSSGYIWRSSVTTSSAPASAIGGGTSCPSPSTSPFKIADLVSANSAANPLFRYNAASAASVSTVGLTFALNAGNAGHSDVSTLRAGAFVRAQAETALPVTPTDIGASCSDSGVPTLTLAASVGSLNVSYTDIDGHPLAATVAAGQSVALPNGTTSVVANVTSSSGALSQLLKTLAC